MSENKNSVSEAAVLDALRGVMDPELHKDLVTLNMIKNIKTEGETVRFDLVLTTPACPLRSVIERDARNAVAALPGVEKVEIKVSANVPNDQRLKRAADIHVRNAIAVGSGKGGVGKTTVAVNLAIALAKSGAHVGLLDADIYGPNVPTMIGVLEMPRGHDNRMVPAEKYGVKVMSIGFLVPPDQPLIWRGPMLHSAIQQFINDVEWGDLDYLIIDLPPGTGDAPLSLAQTIPLSGAVIVTLPQQVSLDDARRGLEMFRKLDIPIFGVIENMSYLELPDGTRMDVFGTGGGEKLSREAGVPYLGGIPMEPNVRMGGDNGNPIVVTHPDSPVGKSMISMAENIAARASVLALEKN